LKIDYFCGKTGLVKEGLWGSVLSFLCFVWRIHVIIGIRKLGISYIKAALGSVTKWIFGVVG
jgi:hypothetical protein